MTDTVDSGATGNENTVTENTQLESAATPDAGSTEGTPTTPTKKLSLSEIIEAEDKKLSAPVEQKPAVAAAPVAQKPVVAEVPKDPVTGQQLEPVKAPVSIPLSLRSDFEKLPRSYQEYLVKRESEVQSVLKQSAQSKQFERDVRQIYAPYESLFKQHNVNPLAHTQTLFQTDHALRYGDPRQKAMIIADIIKSCQPDANALQAALAGQLQHIPAPVTSPQKTLDQQVEERLAQRAGESQEADGMKALEAFQNNPANKYFPYVREIMGKALDSGLVSGNSWDEIWTNAYAFACANHPEVKADMEREAQAAAASATPQQQVAAAATPAAKKPVVGLKPTNGAAASPVARKTKGLDAAIRAAMNEQEG